MDRKEPRDDDERYSEDKSPPELRGSDPTGDIHVIGDGQLSRAWLRRGHLSHRGQPTFFHQMLELPDRVVGLRQGCFCPLPGNAQRVGPNVQRVRSNAVLTAGLAQTSEPLPRPAPALNWSLRDRV